MANADPAASSPVPDHGSLDGDRGPAVEQDRDDDDDEEEPMDPWAQATSGARAPRLDPEEFQRFRDFMQHRAPSRSWRARRGSEEHDDRDDGDDNSKGSSSGAASILGRAKQFPGLPHPCEALAGHDKGSGRGLEALCC